MSRSNDPGHFFQTESSLSEIQRKQAKSSNTRGNPIKVPSKILAIVRDPNESGCVFIAESAGNVRRVVVETGEQNSVYRGALAPVTSIALSPSGKTLYAGCWDKTVWSWDVITRKPGRRFEGHSDFVKCLLCIASPAPFANSGDVKSSTTVNSDPSRQKEKGQGDIKEQDGAGQSTILISGSADATIVIWNASTGQKLHVLKGHSRAVLDLAIDPTTFDLRPPQLQIHEPLQYKSNTSLTLFSAGSDRTIRRWNISGSFDTATTATDDPEEIIAHETSVNKLWFCDAFHDEPQTNANDQSNADADADTESELWTASSDGTSRCLLRNKAWTHDKERVLQHPDFVKDVVVDEVGGWVVTACRDEHVRVWDASSGELFHVYEGHFEEVTGLVVVGKMVVSVSIDGTIRRWSLERTQMIEYKEEAERERVAKEQGILKQDVTPQKSLMTEEEERELAELMADDDDDDDD